jgi:DNA-binding LytR/AlgR family response regulator
MPIKILYPPELEDFVTDCFHNPDEHAAIIELVNPFIDLGGGILKLSKKLLPKPIIYAEILYATATEGGCILVLKDRIRELSISLDNLSKHLKGEFFVRIHRKTLVRISEVIKLEQNSVTMSNGKKLTVSKRRFPECEALSKAGKLPPLTK